MDVLDDFVGTVDSDIVVVTTIDPALQSAAERAIVDELTAKGQRFNVGQGALVAMRPDGAVKALVGGRNYAESQFNRATVARSASPARPSSPSSISPRIERGLTPDTVREDAPVIDQRLGARELHPRLSRARSPCATRSRYRSIRLRPGSAMEVGPKAVVQTAQRLGIASPLQANASIALGTSEVTPLELVGAYAAFANGGVGVIPYVITQVKTAAGKVIYSRAEGGGLGQVVEPNAVAMMNAMMHETFVTGTARAGAIPGWETAGKTGTSQDFRDAWFVGYTATLVAGVWLGNDDGEPTKRVSGGNLPVEIWARFMKIALAAQQPVPLPGGAARRTPAVAGGADAPIAGVGRRSAASEARPRRAAGSRRPPGPRLAAGFRQLSGNRFPAVGMSSWIATRVRGSGRTARRRDRCRSPRSPAASGRRRAAERLAEPDPDERREGHLADAEKRRGRAGAVRERHHGRGHAPAACVRPTPAA